MAKDSDDYYRYIEYLQKQMLSSGWEEYFDAKRWASHTEKIFENLKNISPETKRNETLLSHMSRLSNAGPRTAFEVPSIEAVFQTTFEEVQMAAGNIGLRPIRPVELITSTDISVSPAARPGSDKHLLFVGLGTSQFCNYWSKAVTAVVMAIPNAIGLRAVANSADMKEIFRSEPSGIFLASRLALHYAFFQTLLGFGRVEQKDGLLAYRAQLLHAMEVASIAHEYAHFVAEERISKFTGVLDVQTNHELEHFCDELGLQISREVGNTCENLLIVSGVGSLVLFRVIQLSRALREHLIVSQIIPQSGPSGVTESSHPIIEDRILRLKRNVILKTAHDQRDDIEKFFSEYDIILRAMCDIVLDCAKNYKQSDK